MNYQLKMKKIHLKRNYDFIDKFDEILGRSLFQNEIYWCALIWESIDLQKSKDISIEKADKYIDNNFSLVIAGNEEVMIHRLWPSSNQNDEQTDNPSIVELDQILWQGDLSNGNNILHYNIWIMENDAELPKINEIVSKFRSVMKMSNFQKIVDLIKDKVRPNVITEALITTLREIGQ